MSREGDQQSGTAGQDAFDELPGPPQTSGLAIASLVCGICGVFTCGISALVGLILGIIGLRRISRSEGQLTGQGLAVTGIVVSAIVVVLVPLAIALQGMMLFPALSGARAEARKAACQANLHSIGIGLTLYRNGFENELPETLGDLYPEYVESEMVFACPGTDKTVIGRDGLPQDYQYVGRLHPETHPLVIVAYDRRGNHDDGRNVLFVDTHVEWLDEDGFHAQLQESLERVKRDWEQYTPERQAALEAFYRDEAGPED